MNDLEGLIPWLVYLPMAGFLITALVGRRLGKQAHWIPVLAIFVVWVIAMALVVQVLTEAAPLLPGSQTTHGYEVHLFTWIPAGSFVVEVGFVIDALTACLLIVVTTIGLLVHVYSIGYMSHDAGYWRFFAYLNLFMFSMLLLVLATSFLVVGHTGRMQDLSMTVEKIAAFSRLRLDVMAVEETLESAREEIEDLRLSVR